MCDFVHLHNHSHYSLQDAACTVDSLINKAVEQNMNALALTDHGVMYGAAEFSKKAVKNNIKPILGTEAYIVMDGSRFDRGKAKPDAGRKRSKHYNHLVLLVKNKIGYHNLLKLTSRAYTEGFYYKPRIDLELLNQYKEGLIATSACLAGPVSVHLINGDYEKAKHAAIQLKEIFHDDFYLELQDHGIPEDKAVMEGMPRLSKELGIKMVATNDIHYIEQEHSIPHNILLLLSDKKGDSDYHKLKYRTDQIYFKSAHEMKELFKNYDGAIENTLEITEKVNFNLEFGGYHPPLFPIPPDSKAKNLEEYFELLATEGLHKRFPKINKDIEDRFNYEIGIIKQMGYPGYFLIVQDYINAAKRKGILVGPGRGSAAGSIVAYALGITNVNPLPYNLLFERFLNPARKSMPDIDVDFADDQRGDIIEYTKHKYGEKSVCQIVTFNRLSSKAVLRDVARVLKIPIPRVNEITKWIPSEFGKVYSLEKAFKEVPELKWVNKSDDPQLKEWIKYSKVLEGMNRNASKHAAGVVITPGDVTDFIPIALAAKTGDIVTQYNMKQIDDAGVLKMDFLGLRTLSIIRDALKLIKQTRGEDIDIDEIPMDNKETFKLFSQGRTTAVFQFESSPMKEYLKKLHPESISDLAAMNALYRPGPMKNIDEFIDRKHGKKKIIYLHPSLEEILSDTYGIIVYQEQVMQIANKVGGMSLAEADLMRRAMGKKDLAAMGEQKIIFIEKAVKTGIDKNTAQKIIDEVVEFANYGFNKSHAVAYSFVAYQTAYLKANYLPEFLAANLTNEFGNPDKVSILLDDCRKQHVEVLPPDINKPSTFFNVKDGKIIFGMSAIKNVGVNAVAELERARKENNKNFTGIYDLCSSIDTRVVNKRAMEGLLLAGAFDTLHNGSRAKNFAAIEDALSFGSKAKEAKKQHVGSLFGSNGEDFIIQEPELPNVPDWEAKERLAREREVLGFYLSDHPLRKYYSEYNSFATIHLGEPETFENKEYVRACGVVTSMRTRMDKSGRNMAFFKLDDFSGSCEGIMFAKIFKDYGELIQPEATILVKAKLESSGDEIKLHVDEAMPLSDAKYQLTKKIIIYLHSDTHKPEDVTKLKNILDNHEGNLSLFIRIVDEGKKRDFQTGYRIKLSDDFINEVNNLLGESAVKFSTM